MHLDDCTHAYVCTCGVASAYKVDTCVCTCGVPSTYEVKEKLYTARGRQDPTGRTFILSVLKVGTERGFGRKMTTKMKTELLTQYVMSG